MYVFGEQRPDLPQLFLKDGTILNVTDYWLVDNQVHFTIIEQEDGKPAEHVIDFEALDLQTTVDASTRRGFYCATNHSSSMCATILKDRLRS